MVHTLDATAVRRWCRLGLARLREARHEIDAINVYPVADGDTGSNLCSTMVAVVRELDGSRDPASDDLPDTLQTITRAALLGARGNSGVILSQMLRGLAEGLAGDGRVGDGQALARGLTRAAELGYAAVGTPVEGTVLTVVRAAALSASRAADAGGTLSDVADAASEGARTALRHTPEQLGVLRAAGVVDAGGRGLVVLVDVLATVLRGDDDADERPGAGLLGTGSDTSPDTGADIGSAVRQPGSPTTAEPLDGTGQGGAGGATYGATYSATYEVMYLLDATADRVDSLRHELAALGDSLVVVGGEELWNVHVHVADPGAAVEAGIRAGRPHRVRITHLGGTAPGPRDQGRHVVAVAPGAGLSEVLGSAGATVVTCEPDEAPAVEALYEAIQRGCAGEVVVLPDSEHTRAVAEAVADQARSEGMRVAVLPTRAAVQVLAALAVHDRDRDFDDDVVAMTAAARSTRHGEVCVAESQAVTSAGVCSPGDVLGLVEGDVAVIGQGTASVACAVVDRLLSGGGELVTLVNGRDADSALAKDVLAHLHDARPDVETVSYDGGQARYPLLLGVE